MTTAPLSRPRVLLLGLAGTRWLFGIALASGMVAWLGEASLGVLDPVDHVGYPLLCLGLLALQGLLWWAPGGLRWWQRSGTTLVAAYFALLMFGLMWRDDPGPTIYTLATAIPWMLGGLLLMFSTWPPRQALALSIGMLVLIFLPGMVRRFGPHPPLWLLESWPFVLNAIFAATMYCLALYGVSRQLSHFLTLVPAQAEQITAGELAQARVQELERSREQIEAASRAKSEFLATLGHEIRTPMNTVLGMLQLTLVEGLPPEQQQRLKQAQRAGETLLHMIDSLLDFANLDAGRLQLDLAPLRVEDVMAEAVDAVRASAQAKHIELLCEFAAPQLLDDDGWRRGDALRLGQVLTELLTNAVKFTAKGQVRLRVSLEVAESTDWLTWQVRDSGIGIPEEQLQQLFTPFQQADGGIARRFGGAGLGLAITHRLARLMGGTLTARSFPGRGSEFELRLPMARCAATSPERPLPSQTVWLVQAPHSSGHAALCEQLQHVAPRAELRIWSLGEDALAACVERRPQLDVLLVDWVLPDMDGSQLLERMTTRLGSLPARRTVLLASFDTPALRERAARLGAQQLCLKPVLPPQLRVLLNPKAALPPLPVPGSARGPETTDHAALVTEFDHLLANADSRAVTLWATHESELLELLPASQVKALAGAMERLDFESAQAALSHALPSATMPKPDPQEPR